MKEIMLVSDLIDEFGFGNLYLDDDLLFGGVVVVFFSFRNNLFVNYVVNDFGFVNIDIDVFVENKILVE